MVAGPQRGEEPPDSLSRFVERAVSLWDLDAHSIKPVKVRENAIFRVDSRSGMPLALRIHRLGYHTDDALQSEFHWLKALRAAGIGVPESIPSKSGRDFEVIGVEGIPQARQVDVSEWKSGQPLGSTEAGIAGDPRSIVNRYRRLGMVTASMHNQAQNWKPPVRFIRHSWDIEGLVGNRPLWGPFWGLSWLSGAEQELVARARSALQEDLAIYGPARGDFSLIHADLNPENVLVDGDQMQIIDFDDSGFGWHLFDIATVLYFLRGRSYFGSLSGAYLDGYRTVRALTDEQHSWLPAFTAARALTYLGWIHTRRDTDHVRRSAGELQQNACQAIDEYLQRRVR